MAMHQCPGRRGSKDGDYEDSEEPLWTARSFSRFAVLGGTFRWSWRRMNIFTHFEMVCTRQRDCLISKSFLSYNALLSSHLKIVLLAGTYSSHAETCSFHCNLSLTAACHNMSTAYHGNVYSVPRISYYENALFAAEGASQSCEFASCSFTATDFIVISCFLMSVQSRRRGPL